METLTEEQRRAVPGEAEPPVTDARRRSQAFALLVAMRPPEWIKTLLVFAGLLFSQKLNEGPQVVDALMTFIAFCAMYKVLPDATIAWRDVIVGALVATVLFGAGKYVIALYIANSNIASSFGAAWALVVLLLWIFYSSQIFLLGAEFTRAWAQVWGSHKVGKPQ